MKVRSACREIQTHSRLPFGFRLRHPASEITPLKMTREVSLSFKLTKTAKAVLYLNLSLITYHSSLTKVRNHLCNISGSHDDDHIVFCCVFVEIICNIGELCDELRLLTERVDLIGEGLA